MQCRVCGDTATGTNYGVVSCMACKLFFQRHRLEVDDNRHTLKCRFPNGQCTIDENTRKYCISCRLTACVQAGMRRKPCSSPVSAQNRQLLEDNYRSSVQQKYQRAQLVSLDLLQADRSSLSVHQWSLISNITHVYDPLFEEHKQKICLLQINDDQKPMKLRLKMSNYQQLAATYFTFITPFLAGIPDYQSLAPSDRLALVHQNISTLTGFHSHYITSTIGFIPYFNRNYTAIIEMIYGNEVVLENEKLRQNLDSIFHADLLLIKLTLVIFAFSNVSPCVSSTTYTTSKSTNDELMLSKMILQIQNTYVDVLWRYMLFRFGNGETVVHLYSKIIYNCLRMQQFSNRIAEQNKLHKDMVDTLIEQV